MTCSISYCDSDVKIKKFQLCGKHYENFRRTGDPISLHEKKRLAPKASCEVSGCTRAARARGLCNRHYENLRRYGDAVPQRDRPLNKRLREIGWDITERGCWEWRGFRNELGYGIFSAERLGLVHARAHRVVYEHLTGDEVGDRVLRHRCDNPPCVNPAHLETGTQADNINDMMERGRHWLHLRTECKHGHDLTLPGATREARRGERVYMACVECARRRAREYARRIRSQEQ